MEHEVAQNAQSKKSKHKTLFLQVDQDKWMRDWENQEQEKET